MGLKKLTNLVDSMEECERVLEQLEAFTLLLYKSLKKTIDMIRIETANRSLVQVQQQQQEWSGDLHPFSLQWGRNQLIVAPISIPVLAHPDFLVAETFALPESIQNKLVGRLVLFYQMLHKEIEAIPIGEIYMFSDERWCTSGNIPPVRQNKYERQMLEDFSLALLEGITYSVAGCHHQSLQNTTFDSVSQRILHPIDVGALTG